MAVRSGPKWADVVVVDEEGSCCMAEGRGVSSREMAQVTFLQ